MGAWGEAAAAVVSPRAEPASSSSPRYLASGSGDTTVRFWDLSTETPQFTAKGGFRGALEGQLPTPLPQGPPACSGGRTEQSLVTA